MDRRSNSHVGKILRTAAIVALVTIMLAIVTYVGGYLLLGEFAECSPPIGSERWGILRTFPCHWQAEVFTPAAKIEAAIRGREVFAVEDYRGNPFE